MKINTHLVERLIRDQFPQWAHLPIKPVEFSSWDNRTFHLGETLSIRLPSSARYAAQVEKEQRWLPILAPNLPLAIPKPVAMGNPAADYPWHWSVYQWLEGQTATAENISDPFVFAKTLAEFLIALQACDTTQGPPAGPENFHRGGDLSVYDAETRNAISKVKDKRQSDLLLKVWRRALASKWGLDPVWVHGDIAVGNLLVNHGKLVAVIDFGQLAVGDPACDLGIYWTFLYGANGKLFRETLNLCDDTWDRARGWVLWKTLCHPVAGTNCGDILETICS